jgi:hypothetical protein
MKAHSSSSAGLIFWGQVPMRQRLPLTCGAPTWSGPPAGEFRPPRCYAGALALAWLLASLPLFGGVARAQDRGTLQVAAQVVSTAPSQLALAAGLAVVSLRAAPAGQTLASIQVATQPGSDRNGRTARRPRTLLTISFLRN